MMNRLRTRFGPSILLLIVCASASGSPMKRVSPSELRQELSVLNAAHKSDKAQAERLSTQQLTQRLDSSVARRLIAEAPGEQTRQQLRVLWDASAFLDPPADEIPARAAPDRDAQKAMLALSIHYVATTVRTLPNFLATRRTQRFEIVPQTQLSASHDVGQIGRSTQSNDRFAIAEELKDQPYEYRGLTVTSVAYRDGRETGDPAPLRVSAKDKPPKNSSAKMKSDGNGDAVKEEAHPGLVSWGEYGPILGIVLVDAAKSKVGWVHWEQFEGSAVAVFSVGVEKANSHFVVHQFSRQQAGKAATTGGGSGSAGEQQQSAYHARLTLNPETGTILRVAIQSDPTPGDSIRRGDVLVEYGAVMIGDKTYTCPIHSVALAKSRNQVQLVAHGTPYEVLESELNDVEFTDYRRFGSETTMVTSAADRPDVGKPDLDPKPVDPAQAGEIAAEVAGSKPENDLAASRSSSLPAAPSGEAGINAEDRGEAPTSESDSSDLSTAVVLNQQEEEVLLRSVIDMPGMAEPAGSAGGSEGASLTPKESAGNFSLQATTRLVDITLLAQDKHGRPVKDLRQDQLELLDNGRRQNPHGFRLLRDPASPPIQVSDDHTFSNSTGDGQATGPVDTVILLVDESHLPFLDLGRARDEILQFLATNKPNARVGLYSLGEHGFQILADPTSDLTRIRSVFAAWVPSASAVSKAQSLDVRNRQQIDTVRSVTDLNSVNGNTIETPDSITSIDPQLRKLGDNPLQFALSSMLSLARHFGPAPGHKSLVWISGDSALVNWDDRAIGMDKSANDFAAAIVHTREALNEANMSLYAVNASSLGVGGAAVDPSLSNANVELNPTANSAPPGFAPPRNSTDGRATAQMQQDTRPIQGSVRLLAESTGGRAVNRGSDLKATLAGILADSDEFYEMAFTPDQPADGKLHTLLIKSSRKDIRLHYRSEYLYSADAPDTRQRMQQAIWAPEESTGISLTAEPVTGQSEKLGIRVRIRLKGLAVERKGQRWTDQLYIFLAERNDGLQQAKVDGDTMRLSLTQSTYDSGIPGGIPYQHDLEALPRLGSIRVIVVDGNSGRMGTVTVPTSAFRN